MKNRRISSRDLEKLQKRAVMEGIPYQTLIASTLHKFVTGKLKEASNFALHRIAKIRSNKKSKGNSRCLCFEPRYTGVRS